MRYEFTTDKVGSMRLHDFKGINGNILTLKGINSLESDANIIIGGVNQLLGIVNFQNEYDPEDAIRTVNQNVISN